MPKFAARVKNADQMMTAACASDKGIEVVFADGCSGLIPFSDLPEIGTFSSLETIELPNSFELVLRNRRGEALELPWDFARPYCDPDYQSRVESIAEQGRRTIGEKIRRLREAAGITQEGLASAAGIGRVTVTRIENGEQSPRYETLLALAKAMGREPGELITP